MQGDARIVALFNASCAAPVAEWQYYLASGHQFVASHACAKAPDGLPSDLSLGVFVDDIGKTHPVAPTAADVAATTSLSSSAHDYSLSTESGCTQSLEKLVSVSVIAGQGSSSRKPPYLR